MYFQNRSNGYIEQVSLPFLWTLLFGPLYFASRGVWTHAIVSFFLAFMTIGISWLFYPFFASQILETSYLRKGWVPLSRAEVREQTRRR
jgi:peptidoglycan biosynthesis protein MviN/MurJ (putative lipid II flippase)